MDISTESLQGWLDDAWDAANNDANSLRVQMRSYESSARGKSSGGTLASVAKNTSSQSYRGPGVGSYTLVQIADAWRMLINTYDEISCWITWAIANPPTNPPPCWPTQAQVGENGDLDGLIYPAMKKKIRVIYDYQIDLTDLFLQPTLGEFARPLTW